MFFWENILFSFDSFDCQNIGRTLGFDALRPGASKTATTEDNLSYRQTANLGWSV